MSQYQEIHTSYNHIPTAKYIATALVISIVVFSVVVIIHALLGHMSIML
jgi:hypothetical protein